MINELNIIDQVPELARLLVIEMQRIQKPQSDLMSTSEAFREYGQAWVKRLLASDLLKVTKHGNRKMLSRSEMERAKAKENAAARILVRKRRSS